MQLLSSNILKETKKLLTVRTHLFASVFKKYEDVHSKRMNQMTNSIPSQKQLSSFVFKYNEQDINSQKIDLSDLSIKSLPDTQQLFKNVPTLKHNLHQHMNGAITQKDIGVNIPQSITAQFLQSISSYVKPSQDNKLRQHSQQKKIKYLSSTSSISSPLSQVIFALSSFRRPDFGNVYEDEDEPKIFMISTRKPITFMLRPLPNDQYAIDSGPGLFKVSNEVLLENGLVLQYLLTTPKQQIQKELEEKISKSGFEKPQYYRYCVVNDNFFLRSQIDCRGKNANGEDIVFEIKSRACAPIRYDVDNYQKYLDYPINTKLGKLESYEREYYDLIRGAFMKYGLQLRIGGMDGAFVAYHNTRKIYGYQYITAKQIYKRIFKNEYNMDLMFMLSSKALSNILEVITSQFKECKDSLKIGFYAASGRKSIIVFVQQMSIDKQYKSITLDPQNIDNISQYFNRVQPLRNPVFKYQFYFYLYHNGQLIRHPQIMFEPTDNVELRWKYQKYNRASANDYKGFLHDAEKLEWTLGVFRYNGMWYKINDE